MSQTNEKKLKHLEFVQGAISRMSSNSFKIKGWYITVITAIIALTVETNNYLYLLVGYIPIMLFWALDSYYLQQERRFTEVYKIVSGESEDKIDFDMNKQIKGQCILKVAFSKTIWPLYVIPAILFMIILIVIFILLASGVLRVI